jgi:hypothetical protein
MLTINPTQPDLILWTVRLNRKSMTDFLSYGAAVLMMIMMLKDLE